MKYYLIISIVISFYCYGFEVNDDDDDEIRSTQAYIFIHIDKDHGNIIGATLISEHILLTTAFALTQYKGKPLLAKMQNNANKYPAYMTVVFYDYTPDDINENNFGLVIFQDKLTTDLVKPVKLIEPNEKFTENSKTRLTGASLKRSIPISHIDFMQLTKCPHSISNKQMLCNVVDKESAEKTCHPLEGGAMFVKVKRGEEQVNVFAGLSLRSISNCQKDTMVYVLRTNIPEIFNWIQSVKELIN